MVGYETISLQKKKKARGTRFPPVKELLENDSNLNYSSYNNLDARKHLIMMGQIMQSLAILLIKSTRNDKS